MKNENEMNYENDEKNKNEMKNENDEKNENEKKDENEEKNMCIWQDNSCRGPEVDCTVYTIFSQV